MEIDKLLLLLRKSERTILFSIIIQSFISYASLFIVFDSFKHLPAFQEIILAVALAIVSLTGIATLLYFYSVLFKINIWLSALWIAIFVSSYITLLYGVDNHSFHYLQGLWFFDLFPAGLLGIAVLWFCRNRKKYEKYIDVPANSDQEDKQDI